MARPCACDRCGRSAGAAYAAGDCRLCWLYHHRADYRAGWDAGASATAGRLPPCRHRGPAIEERACPSCRGAVRLKVFACAVHGRCLPIRSVPGLACCAVCPDAAPSADAPAGGH